MSNHLDELTLRIGNVIDRLTCGVQLRFLDPLDADIGKTRWPQTCC